MLGVFVGADTGRLLLGGKVDITGFTAEGIEV
jgi:hypothetical protein